MKKLVAFTALATLGLMIFDVDTAQAAAEGSEDAIALAKASSSGLKGIGGGLAAGIGALPGGTGHATGGPYQNRRANDENRKQCISRALCTF